MLPPGQVLAGTYIAKQAVSVAGDAVVGTGKFLSQLSSKISEKTSEENQQTETNNAVGTKSHLLNSSIFNSKYSSINEEAAALKSSVSSRLRDLFTKNGIDLGTEINLQTDSMGTIRVQGDHPDKAQIESLLAGAPDLSNDFRKSSGMESLLKAAKEAIEFQNAYAKNPQKAVQDYAHLFKDSKSENVTLRLTQQKFEILFS